MIKAMNIGMKILLTLIFVFYLLEEIEAEKPEDVNVPSDNHPNCNNTQTEEICDFTGSQQYIVYVSETLTNSSRKLIIIGAHIVKLIDESINYSEIVLENCKDVETRTSKISSYKLTLTNSSASCIEETVNYFKSTNSKIKILVLSNTTEFDIVDSKIGTLKAKSNSLTPKIVSSDVAMLDLEISGNSKLSIEDSNIQMVKKLNYTSTNNNSVCVNSTFKTILKGSVEISNGEMIFRNTEFSADSQAFKIKKGTLIFDDIPSRLSSENVILEKDGEFLLRTRDSYRVFTMRFQIEKQFYNGENNSNTFFPLERVMLKDQTLLISLSLLGLVIFLSILIITLYVVHKKYTSNKKDSKNCKSFDELMLNKEKQDLNKINGREYSRRNQDMNNYNNKNKEELNPDELCEYSEPQVSPGQKILPVVNKMTDTRLNKNFGNRRANETCDYNDSQVPPPPKILTVPTEVRYNELEDYSEPDFPVQEEPEMYSDVDVLQGPPDDVEEYSDIDCLSELNKKLYNKPMNNLSSDKFSSNDIIYSDNINPSVKVNELKEHLKMVGFNNAQLHSPYQRLNQINANTQNKSNNPNILPKPTNTNYNPNFQTGKQNVPNVSFLSRNKDQLGKLEPPNILPQVNPLTPKHFLLNKSHPAPNVSRRSPKTAKTQTQPPLPVQTIQVEEEENFYEEFTEN